ncbi:hypothetical protein [Petroclostridium sp. X23]|jgi:ATPase subunit of ABC transporter with duplicated ATPase domains|uniref:hypothetical protein n=1 Tax=Petroclostridium sp. X23 TaxID=3045146 RepID=UPI0024ACC60C|nr:hypothetical protein [Petroclostridium sp. X23]WHH58529.1 hypothetical protein QKW49_22475 [Petroclostridium sp. X23]
MTSAEKGNLFSVFTDVERLEDEKNRMSNTFTDMIKNEIDATDEQEVYNNLRNMIYKYKDDGLALTVMEEMSEALTNGAKLSEILLIAADEIQLDTPVNTLDLDQFNKYE